MALMRRISSVWNSMKIMLTTIGLKFNFLTASTFIKYLLSSGPEHVGKSSKLLFCRGVYRILCCLFSSFMCNLLIVDTNIPISFIMDWSIQKGCEWYERLWCGKINILWTRGCKVVWRLWVWKKQRWKTAGDYRIFEIGLYGRHNDIYIYLT